MIRRIALLVSCVFVSGCFVFDELDNGTKIMEQNAKKTEAAPAPQGRPGPQTGSGWWANAKSLSGPVSDDAGKNPAVACKVGTTTRFMRKDDCLSQGGHPAS